MGAVYKRKIVKEATFQLLVAERRKEISQLRGGWCRWTKMNLSREGRWNCPKVFRRPFRARGFVGTVYCHSLHTGKVFQSASMRLNGGLKCFLELFGHILLSEHFFSSDPTLP
jgi:hypothetical protein